MRSGGLLVVAVLAACDDGGGGGGDGGTTSGHYTISNVKYGDTGGGVLAAASYAHPMIVSEGQRVVAIGYGPSSNNDRMITGYTDGELAFARVSMASSARLSSVVFDGEGGFFIAGTKPYVWSEPIISRWDASGNLLWNKGYSLESVPTWNIAIGAGASPDVGLGTFTAGKLPVIAGHGVMVIDGAGTTLWTRLFDGEMQLAHALTDDSGFTVYGRKYESIYQFRFDWAGTLVSALKSPSGIVDNAKLYPPHRHADGTITFAYETYNEFATIVGGTLRLAADGSLVDNYRYDISGTGGVNRGLKDGFASHPLSDDLVSSRRFYTSEQNTNQVTNVHIAFRVGADGSPIGFDWSQHDGAFAKFDDGRVMAVGQTQIGVGDLDVKCSHGYVQITNMFKANDRIAPIAPFAAHTETTTTVSPVMHDEPIQVMSAPLSVNEVPNSGCP